MKRTLRILKLVFLGIFLPVTALLEDVEKEPVFGGAIDPNSARNETLAGGTSPD